MPMPSPYGSIGAKLAAMAEAANLDAAQYADVVRRADHVASLAAFDFAETRDDVSREKANINADLQCLGLPAIFN